jgi:D-alanyl-lipoteichoic acid acyltransferase DltB (MBOAT superfamily)
MSLVSLPFILFCVFLLLAYYTVGRKIQWIVLLVAGTVFYACGDWHNLAYILITICVQYVCTRLMDRENQAFEKEVSEKQLKGKEKTACKKKYTDRKKRYLLASVLITVGILCYMKYANFIIANINGLIEVLTGSRIAELNILIPLGISFYTFQSLGYVIDVYRGKQRAETNIFRLALFISFFPTITQGPILRFDDVKDQLYINHEFSYENLVTGLERMLWGYLKKLVIAERLALISSAIIDQYAAMQYPGIIIFGGVFLRGLRTYVDFSGGMDIVIGLSQAMGITLPENFERPYMARTYSEFWKRWHITLGAWFKRYVFYPISLSKKFNALGKKSRKILGEKKGKALAPSLASFIVFFIIGIWHGAAWKYVAYGVWQAFFVAQKTLFEDTYEKIAKFFRVDPENRFFILFQMLRTIFLVTLGRYFSTAATLTDAFRMMKQTVTLFTFDIFGKGYFNTFNISKTSFMIMAAGILLIFIVDILNEKGIVLREKLYHGNLVLRWAVLYAGLFIVLLLGMYGPGYDTSTFIYQRF